MNITGMEKIKIHTIILAFPSIRMADVGVATGCELVGRGTIPSRDKIFSSPQRSERFYGPPNLLSSGHQESFPEGKAVEA
jgi:hypothetical protein